LPLGELQAFMEGALQRTMPLAECADLATMTARAIAGNARLSPVEQLDIYREQFWLRHVDSLREDFPTLLHLLGNEAFADLARAYVLAHPPASFTLRDLGVELAAFVAKTAPWKDDAVLAEAARLEWAFIEAFDAPDALPLDPSTLANASEDAWGNARIRFQPAMQRLSLAYPVHELRAKARAGESFDRPAAGRVHVVVYRAGLGHEGSTADKGTLQYIEVEPTAFELLEALGRGEPLAAACEGVAEGAGVDGPGDMETRVSAWFQQWAAFGWVSRVEFA
jgi:hypothetical protein